MTSRVATIETDAAEIEAGMFRHVFRNFAHCFEGKNLFWQFVIIALTYALVASGFDWRYFEATRGVWLMRVWSTAAIVGYLIPYALPLFLYLRGKRKGNRTLIRTAFAIGQAEFLGWVITSIYKAFTGRMPPPLHAKAAVLIDTSRQFHFGFWRDGISWGWPSSHTAVAFAMVFTLVMLHTRKRIQIPALIYALFIGLGVSVTIHWFSEFAAGAILGTLIGVVVGRDFRAAR